MKTLRWWFVESDVKWKLTSDRQMGQSSWCSANLPLVDDILAILFSPFILLCINQICFYWKVYKIDIRFRPNKKGNLNLKVGIGESFSIQIKICGANNCWKIFRTFTSSSIPALFDRFCIQLKCMRGLNRTESSGTWAWDYPSIGIVESFQSYFNRL